MATHETTLHVAAGISPRARLHRDGRRADLSTQVGEGSSFTLTGPPGELRRWLADAVAALDFAEGGDT